MTIKVIVTHDTPDVLRNLVVETMAYDFHSQTPHVTSSIDIKPGESGTFMVHDLRYIRVKVRHI